MSQDIFASQARRGGDFAGVFEYDGDVGYFYLYNLQAAEGKKVVGSLRILSGNTEIDEENVEVRWDSTGGSVGLFLNGVIWAVFNVISGKHFGSLYQHGAVSNVPADERFE